jgi:methylmalonyl-CoA mutase
LRQEYLHPDLVQSNREITADLAGGVTSLLLRFDFGARSGFDPDDGRAVELAGRDGLMVYHLEDLAQLLRGVDLAATPIALEAGAAFLPTAALLVAHWRRAGIAPDQARGAFNADPLAVLARDGELPIPIEDALAQMAELAVWTARHCPHATSVRVGSAPYHHAGATAVQDIAFAVATGIDYLRSMEAAGLTVESAARQILFSFSLGTHHFLAIAKLRAARLLWSRVVEACGGSAAAGAMRIHARTSKRVLTRRDPYVNILRNTSALFAAVLGGCETITSVPFDAAVGLPSDFSRRVARNTPLVLQEEGHLHRVIDPAGGSWYLDSVTEKIAGMAWELLQEIESQGGMTPLLKQGWVLHEIDSAFAIREQNIARRKEGITGVSDFVDAAQNRDALAPPDPRVLRDAASLRVAGLRRENPALHRLAGKASGAEDRFDAAIAAAAAGASLGQLAETLGFHRLDCPRITPLAPHPFAQPFEELRDASDRWRETQGRRPTVFLAKFGSAAHHTARASYARGFFEAGGFAVNGEQAFDDPQSAAKAFAESQAKIAVICSSDKLYPQVVPGAAAALKANGARTVVLAGNPGSQQDAWQQAGVDRFIFIKCDVMATLRELLQEEGVLSS